MKNYSRSHRHPASRLRAALLVIAAVFTLPSIASAGTVVELELKGGIGAATAEYIISGIEHAEETNASLILIRMDTPGGLMSSMRDIITAILNSPVPVVTYVSPAGARADSAGAFILLASHIAAMSPTTHVGAATPVQINGEDIAPTHPREILEEELDDESEEGESEDENVTEDVLEPSTAMGRKVLNDTISYIRNLAERHGRNADWAEEAVRDAATLSAEDALEQNVIEYIAEDLPALLEMIDGHEVRLVSETVAVDTEGATIEKFEASWRIKFLSVIQTPEILVLLGMIGVTGILMEFWNPGAIVPGVLGAICLLLSFYASQVLPVNYAGLALIFLGIALMVAEAYAPSFGALGLGGIAAFVFGAIMMFDTGIPGFGISYTFVIALALIAALFLIWLTGMALKLRRRGAVSGTGSIIGGVGTAMQDFTGEGKVWLEGEAWAAHSEVTIAKDQEVVVTAMDGLTLTVKPARSGNSGRAQLQT